MIVSCAVLYVGAMWVMPSDGTSMTKENIWHGILSFGGMLMIFLTYCIYTAMIRGLDRDGAELLTAFLAFSLISGAFAVLNVFDDKSYVIASAVSELYMLTMMSLIGYLTYYLAYRKEKEKACTGPFHSKKQTELQDPVCFAWFRIWYRDSTISPGHQFPGSAFRPRKPPLPIGVFLISIPCPASAFGRVEIAFEHDAPGKGLLCIVGRFQLVHPGDIISTAFIVGTVSDAVELTAFPCVEFFSDYSDCRVHVFFCVERGIAVVYTDFRFGFSRASGQYE